MSLFPHASYTWCIKDAAFLSKILNAKPGQKIGSGIIQLSNLEWAINLYPNGYNIPKKVSDSNSFQVDLELLSMPPSWNHCITTFHIHCHETASQYTLIVTYSKGKVYGWRDKTCLLSELKDLNISSLTITISVRILRIVLNLKPNLRNQSLFVYPFATQQHLSSSEYKISWRITSKLMPYFACKYPGKCIESDTYFDMFCLQCNPCTERKTTSLYLQLCSFPAHTSKLKMRVVLRCVELNIAKETVWDFTVDDSDVGWSDFCDLEPLKALNTITFEANVLILNQYDMNGDTYDIGIVTKHQSRSETDTDFENDCKIKLDQLTETIHVMQSEIEKRKKHKSRKRRRSSRLARKQSIDDTKEKNNNAPNDDANHNTNAVNQEHHANKEENNSNEEHKKTDGDYKGAFFELMHYLKHPQPKYQFVSNKIHELKELVSSKYDKTKFMIECDPKYEQHSAAIKEYLQLNGNNNKKDEQIKVRNGNINKTLHQTELIQVYHIKKHRRVSKLNGQKGLKAIQKIHYGSVIGEYHGGEYLEHEFERIYHGTKDGEERNAYSFTESVEVEIDTGLVDYFTFCTTDAYEDAYDNANVGNRKRKLVHADDDNHNGKKRRKLNDFEIDPNDNGINVKQTFNIVIDGKGALKQSVLIFMNDCRKYLSFAVATVEDEKYRNIDLVRVDVNGWPRIFGVATRDIEKEEELLAYYGSHYVGIKQQRMLYVDNVQFIKDKIDCICNKYGIHDQRLTL